MEIRDINVKTIQEIKAGDVAFFSKTIMEADTQIFAMISGDYAPHHVNRAFGKTTMYHGSIAHGMLTVGLLAPVLNKLCGDNSLTSSEEVRFRSAVVLNDTVTVRGEVTQMDLEEKKVTVDIVCRKQGAPEDERPYIIGTVVQELF